MKTPIDEDAAEEQAEDIASRLWEEDESSIKKEKFAEYLGSPCVLSANRSQRALL
jgi:hypothetical protein